MQDANHKPLPLMLLAMIFALLVGCASSDTGSTAGQYIDDTVITTKVKTAILAEDGLSGTQVNVETQDGVVQLSGFVNSREQIQRAVEVAQRVEGVKAVRNDMVLK